MGTEYCITFKNTSVLELNPLSYILNLPCWNVIFRNHPMPGKDKLSAVPAMDPQDLYRSHTPTPPPRPSSAPPPERLLTPTPPPKVTTSVESRTFTMAMRRHRRPSSARGSTGKGPIRPLAAGTVIVLLILLVCSSIPTKTSGYGDAFDVISYHSGTLLSI